MILDSIRVPIKPEDTEFQLLCLVFGIEQSQLNNIKYRGIPRGMLKGKVIASAMGI